MRSNRPSQLDAAAAADHIALAKMFRELGQEGRARIHEQLAAEYSPPKPQAVQQEEACAL